VESEKLEELEQKAKVFEQRSNNNQGVITVLLESGKTKDLQITSMTGMLTQIQDNLNRLTNEFDYHRLEDVARFVMAKAPTAEEMNSFLNRRQINQSIFQRPELQCSLFSRSKQMGIHQGKRPAKLLSP
jgi:hypothetical protein